MKRQGFLLALLAAILLVLTFSGTLIHLLTESWWFDSVGFSAVFWTRMGWQFSLWIGTFAIYAAFIWLNYKVAMSFSRDRTFEWLDQPELRPYARTLPSLVAAILTFLIALSAASASAVEWETVLKFLHPSSFGATDPIYGNDIGFYLFRLPFYEAIHGWLLALLSWGLVVAAFVYILKGSINLGRGWTNLLSGNVKSHLGLLLAAIAVLAAIGFWLQRYELLYSSTGAVYGASYTDVHARLQSYWVMGFVTLALGVLFILSLWRSGFALPTYGLLFYITVLIGVGGIYPWFQQQFVVEPNELAKERPYITYNIELTRNAYGLDQVQRKDYPARNTLDRQGLQDNQATIQNIRLWDYRPLLSTYRQLQEIRAYYRFNDVDVDRYTVDGDYRQVMLSPREMDTSELSAQAQNWVNQRLKYTHGYGLAMSPVNVVTPDGLPEFFIRDVPPVSTVNLQVEQPALYYGELTNNYILTGTSTDEFDYPQGDTNAATRYQGSGGVSVGSFWRQLAYAFDFGDFKILISNYPTQETRIHYYRQVQQRLSHIAPFLRFDGDPYVALIGGRQYWIMDAYTVSDRYPYSKPVSLADDGTSVLEGISTLQLLQDNTNYIRNSVKVVTDAYNGTVQFFVVDEDDPVLNTYRQIFPSLFTGSDQIPPEVRAHFRYPQDLLEVQALMYLAYHMQDPEVFYNREDLWRLPREIYEGNAQVTEPYYMIMRLPNGEQEEFVLILPFTPVNRDNMIAWMAARSDGENYGRLLLYEFPKQELVYGPSQIEARINQDPDISSQLTLWDQEGSRVLRGSLLVIPIEQSILYVEPVYLRAEQTELPELTRVIVAYSNQIVMRPTLEESLNVIFDGAQVGAPAEPGPVEPQPETAPPPDTTPPEAAAPAAEIPALVDSARTAYERSQEALSRGDWAEYGRYQNELDRLLDQLDQQTQTTSGTAE